MNRPDWKDAPEWAQYMAQDSDGDWYWYENLPTAKLATWIGWEGRMEFALDGESAWRETLEARPS